MNPNDTSENKAEVIAAWSETIQRSARNALGRAHDALTRAEARLAELKGRRGG